MNIDVENPVFSFEDLLRHLTLLQSLPCEPHGLEQEAIESLSIKFRMDDVSKIPDDSKKCVICLTEYENGDEARRLPCMHAFHVSCIDEWLKTNSSCPLCKTDITQHEKLLNPDEQNERDEPERENFFSLLNRFRELLEQEEEEQELLEQDEEEDDEEYEVEEYEEEVHHNMLPHPRRLRAFFGHSRFIRAQQIANRMNVTSVRRIGEVLEIKSTYAHFIQRCVVHDGYIRRKFCDCPDSRLRTKGKCKHVCAALLHVHRNY